MSILTLFGHPKKTKKLHGCCFKRLQTWKNILWCHHIFSIVSNVIASTFPLTRPLSVGIYQKPVYFLLTIMSNKWLLHLSTIMSYWIYPFVCAHFERDYVYPKPRVRDTEQNKMYRPPQELSIHPPLLPMLPFLLFLHWVYPPCSHLPQVILTLGLCTTLELLFHQLLSPWAPLHPSSGPSQSATPTSSSSFAGCLRCHPNLELPTMRVARGSNLRTTLWVALKLFFSYLPSKKCSGAQQKNRTSLGSDVAVSQLHYRLLIKTSCRQLIINICKV